jgi:hypothetical protein
MKRGILGKSWFSRRDWLLEGNKSDKDWDDHLFTIAGSVAGFFNHFAPGIARVTLHWLR